MKAGKLNQIITFQNPPTERNVNGYKTGDWTDAGTAWAGMITTGGGKFYAAQKINSKTTAVFTMRYTSSVNTTMRIKYGTRIFEILFLNNVDGRFEELEIAAKEEV